jgi:hypothetical protein
MIASSFAKPLNSLKVSNDLVQLPALGIQFVEQGVY